MSKKHEAVSDFSLNAQLLGFVFKGSGQVKSLRVATDKGVWVIKVAKELREDLPTLHPGDWLRLRGEKMVDLKKGKIKLKAWEVMSISGDDRGEIAPPKTKKAPVGKVLICQKSSCCKRGAKAVLNAIETHIDSLQLGDRIRVQKTGCLKGCKRGPNLVVVPERTRYEKVTPTEAKALVDRHFSSIVTGQ